MLNRSVLTREYLRYEVTATVGGEPVNPTGDAVDFAFIPLGTQPAEPDWVQGQWEAVSGRYYARIIVGPGGDVTLAVGTYAVWLRVIDDPEVPVRVVDTIVVEPTPSPTLATVVDIESRLGRPLTEDEAARAPALLVDASATVRREAGGQRFSAGTSTVRLRPAGGVLRLPQHPVVEIVTVRTVEGNDLPYTWDGLTLRLDAFYPVANRDAVVCPAVDVTYEHGYQVVPDDIVGLVAGVVLRALGGGATDGGTESETIGTYSYRVRDAAAAGAKGLLPAERAIARSYRRPAAPIRTMR